MNREPLSRGRTAALPADHRAWAYILVVLATLFWAGNMTLGRALRTQVGPFTLATARMIIASLIFFVMMQRLPKQERALGREWPWLLGMALLGMVGCPVTLYLALRYTTASSTALINGTGPLMTMVLAALFLHARLSRGEIGGALLSLLGVSLVVGGSQLQRGAGGTAGLLGGFSLNPGDIIMLVNVAMWGLYSIMSQIVTRHRAALWATAYSIWFAVPLLIPAALLEWRQTPATITPTVVAAVLFIGVFSTSLAFLAWNEGVRRLGSAGAMAFYNLLPVFGAVLGAVFLAERLAPVQFLGGGLIIAGGLLAALRPAPHQAPLPSAE